MPVDHGLDVLLVHHELVGGHVARVDRPLRLLLGGVTQLHGEGRPPHPVEAGRRAQRLDLALEARDLGVVVDGVLGYVEDAAAHRHLEQLPRDVLWGSRFGHRRRYAEDSA